MSYYSASLVAKYTGYNKYVDSKKEILELINPNPDLNLNSIQLKLATLELSKNVVLPSNAKDLNKIDESSLVELSNAIGADTNKIQSALNCFYGSSNEHNVIDMIKSKYGYDVVENNNKCYSMVIGNVKICGRIDGFVYLNGEKYLVEIKSRKNRIFKQMPIYEKVQILLYTKLCDCTKVMYIQNHKKELSLEVFENFVDEELYSEVIKRLQIVHRCIQGENPDELCYWF